MNTSKQPTPHSPTPTPWRVRPGPNQTAIMDKNQTVTIANTSLNRNSENQDQDRDVANAAYIVKAVNAYAAIQNKRLYDERDALKKENARLRGVLQYIGWMLSVARSREPSSEAKVRIVRIEGKVKEALTRPPESRR